MTTRPRFHYAFPVDDLEKAREFYTGMIGCRIGRSSDRWIDFDMYGHQVVAHLSPEECGQGQSTAVDGKAVPVRHFGLVLDWEEWERLGERFREAGTEFVVEPYIRFQGQPGEQGTFFVRDPAGNALEFKMFRDIETQLFASS